jgi:ADP-heptose:LPS heptosyltransferase
MIDYWIGVPLCFLLSMVYKVLFWKKDSQLLPKRILFIELSEMGSTILADPAMRKAERHFGAELFFLIFKRNRASLDFLKTVPSDNIFTIREDNLWYLLIDTLGFLWWSRYRRIDSVVDMELFSRFTALLTGLSGARYRIGFYRFFNEGLYRGSFLTHKVSYNPHLHMAKNFIALVNALIINNGECPYSKRKIEPQEIIIAKVPIHDEKVIIMQSRIQSQLPDFIQGKNRLILINPNASELLPQRRWPIEHFANLAIKMLKRWPDMMILLTGSSQEREMADLLANKVANKRLANFAGLVSLSELPDLYHIADLMITNDSGPAHFASVTNMPTIVLFGPETPSLYASLGQTTALSAELACSPCVSASNHRKTACKDPVCMALLAPELVFQAVEKQIESS